MRPAPPIPLFVPYTTLFRSNVTVGGALNSGSGGLIITSTGDNNGITVSAAITTTSGNIRLEASGAGGTLALNNPLQDRKSTRLNSSHRCISYAVFCLKKKKQ